MVEFFVSYRSADGAWAANLIGRVLGGRLGAGAVFLDTTSIPAGDAFPQQIWKALQSCRTLLAVIGPRWLETNAQGVRRIDEPRDLVRREIATALQRGARVVPVLLDGARLPSADALPEDITGLAHRQIVRLSGRGSDRDVERLVDELTAGTDNPVRHGPDSHLTNVFHGDVHADTIGISYRLAGSDGDR
jgi:TIR domain